MPPWIPRSYNGALSGVTIESFQALTGSHSGTLLMLSDHTTIQLYGVSASSLSTSILGGTHI